MELKKIFSLDPVEFSKTISPEETLKGVVLGLLFGLVGAIPWILVGYFGIFASFLGFLISLAAYRGFTLGAGKMHMVGILTIIVSVLLAVPFSEMVLLFIEGLKYGIPFMDALTLTPKIFFDNLGDFFTSIVLGYVFAFLGSWRVLRP